MTTPFSSFELGGTPVDGDIVVGLRNGTNTQFNFQIAAWSVNITQAAHGLVVGNVVRFDGVNYVLAQADTRANADLVGIVSAVLDINTFTLQLEGPVIGLAGLTAGAVHYLSPTVAGALTNVEPSTLGQISKPVLIASSATDGYIFNWRSLPATPGTANYIYNSDGGGFQQWVDTLPTVVQDNITQLDTVAMSGFLTLVGDPVNPLEAATKQYVDAGGATRITVNQVAHGFLAREVIYITGGAYALARADASATSEVVGIVTEVIDANNFAYSVAGEITGFAGLTSGDVLYLSPTVAGAVQNAAPTNPGEVIVPVMVALSATTAMWRNQLGVII